MTEQHYRMTLNDAIAQYGCKFGVIYRIYCDQTGCSYVGQTRDINKNQRLSRIKSHYNALKKSCHPSSKLQMAWNQTNGQSIKDEILEIVAPINRNGTDSNAKSATGSIPGGELCEKMAEAEKRWQKVYSCNQNSLVSVDRHYALKAEELKKLRSTGIINNATFVYFILKLKNPWCDRPLRIKPLELSVEWDISESSVYEAIAKLDQAGLLPDWFEREIYENPEYQVVQRLQDELGGQVEVVTAVGRIDLLTETEVIEVKQVSDWKSALGQILTYSAFFPEHTKRIHLFGDCTPKKKEIIYSTVLSFGVIATFEEVEV